jgi:RimJ/RimL family protein N-acetyltransferase
LTRPLSHADAHIGWCPVERVSELQSFIDEHWRRGHVLARDQNLLLWQNRSDERGRLSVLVAEQEGRIVGMLGMIGFDASVRGARHRGGWMTNWLVVPELRGFGLGRALLGRALESGLDVVGALAANATTQRVLGRLGFAEVVLARWIRVFSVAALEALLEGRKTAYSDAAWAAWRAQEGVERDTDVVATGRAWDAAGWDTAWDRRLAPQLVAGRRDEAYLRHRFVEHPRFHYELLTTDDARGERGGFAAYRIEVVRGGSGRIMRILDFLACDGTSTAKLLGALTAAARSEKVAFADFACTSRLVGEQLAAGGFVREDTLPASLPGRFQPLDFSDRPLVCAFWASPRVAPDTRDFFRTPQLYVTRSDSDLDRPS